MYISQELGNGDFLNDIIIFDGLVKTWFKC